MTTLAEHAICLTASDEHFLAALDKSAREVDAFRARIVGYVPTPNSPRLVNVPGQQQTHAGAKR